MKSDVEVVLGALRRLRATVTRASRRAASAAAGVTGRQLELLGLLDERDPAMVGELAEHVGVTASTMSLTLGRLEAAGLVERSRDPHDRRVMNVRLTEAGLEARSRALGSEPRQVAALLTTLRPDERRRAVDGLALLADAAERWLRRADEHAEALAASDSDDGGDA